MPFHKPDHAYTANNTHRDYRPISRVVIGQEVDYRSLLIYEYEYEYE